MAAHGSGGVCNYGATVPNYIPDQVVQHGDIVYLLSSDNRRVYRWSISAGAYLNPYVVGHQPGLQHCWRRRTMAYSASHQRLYLGYSTGAIRYINVNAGAAEVAFASMPAGVLSLTSAGNFLVAHVGGYLSANGNYVLNSSGVTTDQGGSGYYYYAIDHAWDPVTRACTTPGPEACTTR